MVCWNISYYTYYLNKRIKVVVVVVVILTMQRLVEMDLMRADDGQAEVRNDIRAVCGCSTVYT